MLLFLEQLFSNSQIVEYIGYAASVLILLSLLMSSAKKLRIINLAGGITYTIYGYLIDSYPIMIMNFLISCVNIYYLLKMYKTKDYFNLLPIDKKSVYLKNFIDFYRNDIEKYFTNFDVDVDNSEISFYILRNVIPAGFFIANKVNEDTLRIDFDYVVPTYRDFKMGSYIFKDQKQLFTDKGYHKLITYTDSENHEKYLSRMGFKEIESQKNNLKCYQIKL